MIIQNQNDFSITKIGVEESKETFFTIDPTNSVHLMKMLRNSLYSNKELAVIREYICNAVDANVANQSSKPIQIYAPTKGNPFRVRDFGSGLSSKEVHYFLTNYGASSKRDSNNQVGGFGIGFKSGFSFTDSFTVTSIYKGKQSVYLCALEGSERGMLTCVEECFTDAPSGVEINIPVPEEKTYSFNKELFSFLATMKYPFRLLNEEQIYVGSSNLASMRHHHAMKTLEVDNIPYSINFYTGLEYGPSYIRMGEVTYPIDVHLLNRYLEADVRKQDSEMLKYFNKIIPDNTTVFQLTNSPRLLDMRGKLSTTIVVIDIPIGTIAISPDREKLQYSDHNKALIIKFLVNYHIDKYNTLLKELSDPENYEYNCDIIKAFEDTNSIIDVSPELKRAPIPNPFSDDEDSKIVRKYHGYSLSANYLFGKDNWILASKNIKSYISSLDEMPNVPIISSLQNRLGASGWGYYKGRNEGYNTQHGNIGLISFRKNFDANDVYFGPTSLLKKMLKRGNAPGSLDIVITYGDMKAISIPLYLNTLQSRIDGKDAAFHIHFPTEEYWLWFKNEYCNDITNVENKYLIYNTFLVHDIYAMKNQEIIDLVNPLDKEEQYVSPQVIKPRKKIRRLPKNLVKVYKASEETLLPTIFGCGNCGSTYYDEVEIDINEKQYYYFLIDRYEIYYNDKDGNRYSYISNTSYFYNFLKENNYLDKIVFIKPSQLPLITKKDTQKNIISAITIVELYLNHYIYDYIMNYEFETAIAERLQKIPNSSNIIDDYKAVLGNRLFEEYAYRYRKDENKIRKDIFILGNTLDTWQIVKDHYGGEIIPDLLYKLLSYYQEMLRYQPNNNIFRCFDIAELKLLFPSMIAEATDLIVNNHIAWNKSLFEENITNNKNKGTLFLWLLWQHYRNETDYTSNLLAKYIQSLN